MSYDFLNHIKRKKFRVLENQKIYRNSQSWLKTKPNSQSLFQLPEMRLYSQQLKIEEKQMSKFFDPFDFCLIFFFVQLIFSQIQRLEVRNKSVNFQSRFKIKKIKILSCKRRCTVANQYRNTSCNSSNVLKRSPCSKVVKENKL